LEEKFLFKLIDVTSVLSDPLDGAPNLQMKEFFTLEAVQKFKAAGSAIEAGERRHYNQSKVKFDDQSISSVLSKFKIPKDVRTTVYGGYTGEFAEALRRLGMRVVFTDPLPEWVEAAKGKDFEAYRYSAQEIPRELLGQTDLFASFECYPDLIGESEFYYPFMRFLTTKYGLLFAESKETVESMKGDDGDSRQQLGTFRRWLRPLYRVYGIKRIVMKTTDLNFYHSSADPVSKEALSLDLRVMKAVYDLFARDYKVTSSDVPRISEAVGFPVDRVSVSVGRLASLSDSIHLPYTKVFPFLATQFKGELRIGQKRFYIRP
jgi:hypothetical protein